MTRIAFVGLQDAATRPLISALIGRFDLLAMDRSNQSLAVTRLVFGGPDGRADGADIRFFADHDLDRLASNAGHLQRLATGDHALDLASRARREIGSLRRAAAAIEGHRLDDLLGAERRLERITPDALTPYLRGPRQDAPKPRHPEPSFHTLTRLAQLYLPQGPFACPVELIDTPGLRSSRILPEEVSLAAIEEADCVVLVFDATRPVGPLDEAMLRHLVQCDKSVLAIVDRIDEVADASLVLAGRQRMVARCAPGLDIRVVPASSRFAARAALLKSARQHSAAADPVAAEGYHTESGLGSIGAELSELIFWGPAQRLHCEVVREGHDIAIRAAVALDRVAMSAEESERRIAHKAAEQTTPDAAMLRRFAEIRARGRQKVDAEIEAIWGRINRPVVRALSTGARSLAEEMNQGIERARPDQNRIALPPLAREVLRALETALNDAGGHVAQAIAAMEAEMLDLLREMAPHAPANPVDRSMLLRHALPDETIPAPEALIVEASRRQMLMRGMITRRHRVDHLSERLSSVMMPAVNRAIERGTLILGAESRRLFDDTAARMETRLANPESEAADPNDRRVSELRVRADGCRNIAMRLSRIGAALSTTTIVRKVS